jgi:HAD superfamily hydrolase (TIGR01490 family)
MQALALFDLDGTLLPEDSDHAFGQFLAKEGWVDPSHHAQTNARFLQDYRQACLDITAYVAFATRFLQDYALSDCLALRQRFMDEVIESFIRQEALDLIECHRQQGDTLVLITATNSFVATPIAARLGIPHLIATELVQDEKGRFTGEIAGIPSFQAGKVARLNQWLVQQKQGVNSQTLETLLAQSVFYSDSVNDLPLLERVSRPIATNPDARLRQIAQQRGWAILDLFEARSE